MTGNGGSDKQQITRPMGDIRRRAMAAGVEAWHKTADDLEQVRQALDEKVLTLRATEVEVEGLRSRLNDMESVVLSERARADAATDRASRAEAALWMVRQAVAAIQVDGDRQEGDQ